MISAKILKSTESDTKTNQKNMLEHLQKNNYLTKKSVKFWSVRYRTD